MISIRYGCLHKIGRRTGHRCHLCGERLHVELYGRPGTFVEDTVTVVEPLVAPAEIVYGPAALVEPMMSMLPPLASIADVE